MSAVAPIKHLDRVVGSVSLYGVVDPQVSLRPAFAPLPLRGRDGQETELVEWDYVVEPAVEAAPALEPELAEALARLRWVVPGRNYGPTLIADVSTVLRHFGLEPA